GPVPAGLGLFEVVSGGAGAGAWAGQAGAGESLIRTDGLVVGRDSSNAIVADSSESRLLAEAVGSELPSEWSLVSLCLANGGSGCSGQLLVTRLAQGRPPITLSVPLG
ncbi:unnamed protein product, partial [Discosporangium mesarthrocarpum]